jgi:hypothetical protein
MKIKKAHIIAFLMLTSAGGGAGAVWQFHLSDALTDLDEHLERQSALETKILYLQDTFDGKKPEYIIGEWAKANDPWNSAKNERKGYFRLAQDVPEPVEYPETERIPRFFYEREYPRREQEMFDMLVTNKCLLLMPAPFFNAPDIATLPSNPNEKEVVEWLTNFDRGAYTVKFLAEAGAVEIIDIYPWNERTNKMGILTRQTTGLEFTISMRDLAAFLEKLRIAKEFNQVEAIFLSNLTLRNPNANVSVQMLLTTAVYNVREPEVTPAKSGGSRFGDGRENSPADEEDEVTWWSNFKRNVLYL